MIPATTTIMPEAAAEAHPATYIHTQRCAAAVHAAFFRGVNQAPASYLSLGQEIDRLARALDHLITETHNPASLILRPDNAAAAAEALAISLGGVHACLVEVENTLVGMRVSRHNTERWIDFAIKVQFRAGEERLLELKERVGYHCWSFNLVLRTLMKNDARALLSSIEAIAAPTHLERLLYDQLEGADDDPIVRRFEELSTLHGRSLFASLPADSILRIVMFWTFKAITSLAPVPETNRVSPIGYLNLLKASWLFRKIRSTPATKTTIISPKYDETKAVVALVSTELLFMFRTLVKVGVFPARDAIGRYGDFNIFPMHFADQNTTMASSPLSTERDRQTALEVGGRAQSSVVSSANINSSSSTQGLGQSVVLPPPPPPYSVTEHSPEPKPSRQQQQPASPSVAPQSPPNRAKGHPDPLHVDVGREVDDQVLSLVKPFRDRTIARLPTPPGSGISLGSNRTIVPRGTLRKEVREREDRVPSPSPSAIIDEIYCDSPTLGLEDYFETPVRIEPWTPPAHAYTPTTGTCVVPSPLELSPRPITKDSRKIHSPSVCSSPRSSVMTQLTRSSAEEKIVVPTSTTDRVVKRQSAVQTYDTRAPSPNGLIVDEREWNVDFAVEYGVRPGEIEVMPDRFSAMRLKASGKFSGSYSHWEDCIIRVFENQSTGEYRLLTLRGKNVDQRYLLPSLTELIPEYGYHENFPVIFLREAGPGSYSVQSLAKEKAPKPGRKSSVSSGGSGNSGPPSAASLYYRFSNLDDMFTFQQAFLRESVEADVQNIRTIRYTRGFLSGEHITHKARIQLWKPPATELTGGNSSHRNSEIGGRGVPQVVTATMRTTAPSEQAIIKPTRLILYLDEVAVNIFVTDDVVQTIPQSSPRTLRIRPSSHKTFNNPGSVKACVLGDPKRDLAGGFRLDKEGIGLERQEVFDDFKWFEIEFQTEAECRCFGEEFAEALQQRRRERKMIEELRKKAVRGVKAGEW